VNFDSSKLSKYGVLSGQVDKLKPKIINHANLGYEKKIAKPEITKPNPFNPSLEGTVSSTRDTREDGTPKQSK